MSNEKIPCPVDGCNEEFFSEEAAAAHMKEEHRDDFAPPPVQIIPPVEPPADQVQAVENEKKEDDVLAMVPPGVMEAMDARIDQRVQAALEAERPMIKEAVTGAIQQVLKQAQAAGVQIPGVTEGGVIQGSPVTPTGNALIDLMVRSAGGGGGGDIEAFVRQANQYKALGELFNPPPSLTDRIAQRALMKQFSSLNLITDKMMTQVDKELGLEVK